MRGNGLSAASYVAIADLDPVVADAMLNVLRDAQVAAYTEPCQPVLGTFLEMRVPPLPCDRLYVDETARDRGRALLDEHLPALRESGRKAGHEVTREPAALDEDRLWAELVAGYDSTPSTTVGRWPAQEDLDPEPVEGAGTTRAGERGRRPRTARTRVRSGASTPGDAWTPPGPDTTGTDTTGTDTKGADTPGDAAGPGARARAGVGEERYVPPPPPPLPQLDNVTKLAWLALGGGPALLLVAAVAGLAVPAWLAFLAVLGFVGGFLVLVVRMKGGPPDDEDGAIV